MRGRVFSLLLAAITTIVLCSTPVAVYAEEVASTPVGGPTVGAEAPTVSVGAPALIVVGRDINLCAVYDADGNLIKTFPVSTGREGHKTPVGTFSIYEHTDKGGYHLMVDGTYGRYCMRFKKGGYMFHSVCYAYNGAPEPIQEEVDALGTSVSRGCVRLSVENAKWLYDNTPNGCTVIIADANPQPAQ